MIPIDPIDPIEGLGRKPGAILSGFHFRWIESTFRSWVLFYRFISLAIDLRTALLIFVLSFSDISALAAPKIIPMDFSWLYPITAIARNDKRGNIPKSYMRKDLLAPDSLLTLDGFDGLRSEFSKILDMQYGTGLYATHFLREVNPSYPDLEISPPSCLGKIDNWKLVAVRIDPFQSLAIGSPLYLDLRRKENYLLQHRRVPQIRLTFQPLCRIPRSDKSPVRSTDFSANRKPAFYLADSALHVIYNLFNSNEEMRQHNHLLREYMNKIAQWSNFSDLKESKSPMANRFFRDLSAAETKYLGWLSAPARNTPISKVIKFLVSLANYRQELSKLTNRDTDSSAIASLPPEKAWRFQQNYATGTSGHVRLNIDEQASPVITQPLLSTVVRRGSPAEALVQKARHFMHDFLMKNAIKSNLSEIRNMSTGSGGQNWSFAAMSYNSENFQKKLLSPKKIKLYDTHPLSKLPAELIDLGYYDEKDLGLLNKLRSLPNTIARILQRNNVTYDVQDPEKSMSTAQQERSLADPLLHNGSQQSCFNCHIGHERYTMAKRTMLGHPPQDFGYIVRGFGYFLHVPIISERFFNEADLSTQQINHWISRWGFD